MKAIKGEEIVFTVENKIGKLNEAAALIKADQINIRAVNCDVVSNKAILRFLTSDNQKAKKILSALGEISSREVVIVQMPDEIGQLCLITTKLKEANIDLIRIYGMAQDAGAAANIIFSTNDNDRALAIISGL